MANLMTGYRKFPTLSLPEYFSCGGSCMKLLLNHEDHISAFAPFKKHQEEKKSFIVIRDMPKVAMVEPVSLVESTNIDSHPHKREHEDSDSTHHSAHSPVMQKKLSKEEKRSSNLKSVMKLIECRKADTLKYLEQVSDDEQLVLH